MRDFNHKGKLLQPVSYHGNDVEGMRHAWTVRPEIRDKIIKVEFTPLEKLSSDDLLQQALRQAELSGQGYASRNIPPEVPKTPVKRNIDLLRQLFLLGSYYLQYYPGETVSFLDYLLFLMSQMNNLNLDSLLPLDAGMRFEYAMHPEWNWNQQRIQILSVINQVLHNPKYLTHYNPNRRQGRANSHASNSRGGGGS